MRDRIVAEHAFAIYRKSGLTGRSELAAFFLEDLLPPALNRGFVRNGAATT